MWLLADLQIRWLVRTLTFLNAPTVFAVLIFHSSFFCFGIPSLGEDYQNPRKRINGGGR